MISIPVSEVPGYELLEVGDTFVYNGVEFEVIVVNNDGRLCQAKNPIKYPTSENEITNSWKDSPWRMNMQDYYDFVIT